MRPSLPSLLIAAAITCLLLGAGCGLKDDLYLPESPTPEEQPQDEDEDETDQQDQSSNSRQHNQAKAPHTA